MCVGGGGATGFFENNTSSPVIQNIFVSLGKQHSL